eukprot:scaffold19271_cov28-Tisochrysis_lutea.AAC.5
MSPGSPTSNHAWLTLMERALVVIAAVVPVAASPLARADSHRIEQPVSSPLGSSKGLGGADPSSAKVTSPDAMGVTRGRSSSIESVERCKHARQSDVPLEVERATPSPWTCSAMRRTFPPSVYSPPTESPSACSAARDEAPPTATPKASHDKRKVMSNGTVAAGGDGGTDDAAAGAAGCSATSCAALAVDVRASCGSPSPSPTTTVLPKAIKAVSIGICGARKCRPSDGMCKATSRTFWPSSQTAKATRASPSSEVGERRSSRSSGVDERHSTTEAVRT